MMHTKYIIKNPLQKVKYKCPAIYALVLVLLFSSTPGEAQIELSNGIEVGYPILTNKYNSNIYYKQVTAGLRFGLSFKPAQTQFFPTLNFSFGRTRLPVQQIGDNVAVANMNYLSLMLNGNFVVPFENGNTLYMLGGIGFTKFTSKGLVLAGPHADAEYIHQDSLNNVTKVFPSIGLGFEYVYGQATNSKIYLSLGLMMQYIYLFADRNEYKGTMEDINGKFHDINASMTGHAFVPMGNITLHILTGRGFIFWKKKS